jgi:hypothetical protein
MARTANYVKLDTKTARVRLKPRKEPYYAQITEGLCLGYIRRKTGPGTWTRRELVAGSYQRRPSAKPTTPATQTVATC